MNSAFKSQSLAILFGFVSVFILNSCGVHDRGGSGQIVRPILSTRPPAAYELFDAECQKDRQPVAIEASVIRGWNSAFELSSGLTTFDSSTVTHASLESRFVSGTGYKKSFTRTCSDRSCTKADGSDVEYQRDSGFTPLRICQNGIEYPEDSYEAVALTSIHYLNKGASAYEKHTGKTMSRVHLEVIPTFETTEPGVKASDGKTYDIKYYMTDNLAYFPRQRAIMVFAQSQYAKDNNYDRFWESAFVLMHELGHHIEELLLGNWLRKYGLHWSIQDHSYVADDDAQNLRGQAKMWTVISEAYADDSAFYADDESILSVERVDCIGRNRNVASRYFADGKTAKIFDLAGYNDLLTGVRRSNDCNAVEFSDPHIPGAVFAHLNYETFAVASAGLPDDKKAKKKYNLVLEWRKALGEAHERNPDEENIFKHHKAASEEIFASATAKQKAKICALNAELVPFLTPPFESYCEKSRSAFTQPWNPR